MWPSHLPVHKRIFPYAFSGSLYLPGRKQFLQRLFDRAFRTIRDAGLVTKLPQHLRVFISELGMCSSRAFFSASGAVLAELSGGNPMCARAAPILFFSPDLECLHIRRLSPALALE